MNFLFHIAARWRHLLACTLILLALRAHAAPPTPAAPLRVGTSGDYTPFSYHAPSGELAGFDVAVAQRLAADLGRTIEFVPFRWLELGARMQAGDFGIVMSGVTVRPDRAVSMRFTRPYAVTGSVAIIRRSDSHTFRTPDDLDRPTVHIAVNRGGHLEQVGRRRFPHAQIHTVERNADLPGLLRRGEVGAVISEQFEAQGWVADDLALIGPFTRDIKAYALPAEAVELRRRVDEWLAAREADGWLNAQRRRWLGERAVRTAPEACFDALAAAIDLRLQLMPLVAAVKRRDGLPIEDAAQEARVREHVRSEATAVGLRPSEVVELFRIQIEAAKAVERVAPAETVPSDMMLADLRAAITAVSDQVIAELVRCEPWLSDSRRREQLGATLRTGVTTSGSEPFVGRLVAFLVVGTHRP